MNTGVGCHVLLQGIIPTQRLNPCLLHWWARPLSLAPPGNLAEKCTLKKIEREHTCLACLDSPQIQVGWKKYLFRSNVSILCLQNKAHIPRKLTIARLAESASLVSKGTCPLWGAIRQFPKRKELGLCTQIALRLNSCSSLSRLLDFRTSPVKKGRIIPSS